MTREPYRVRFARLATQALLLAASSAPGVARAQSVPPPAPAVALAGARSTAREALTALLVRLSPDDRRTLTGIYVAFDDSPTDINALAACDDDGDYVVVVSDALLRLARTIAAAEATDEIFGTHDVDDYAALIARSQGPGVRALPPPVGAFDSSQARAPAKLALEIVRLREILGSVVGHELSLLLQGDLVCPNPTATHEHGDDVWTREEREHALAVALKVYAPARVRAADGATTARLLDAGMTEQGGLTWLTVVDHLESSAGPAPSTYATLHPDASARSRVVRAAADQWRLIHAASGPAPSAKTVSPPMSADR